MVVTRVSFLVLLAALCTGPGVIRLHLWWELPEGSGSLAHAELPGASLRPLSCLARSPVSCFLGER